MNPLGHTRDLRGLRLARSVETASLPPHGDIDRLGKAMVASVLAETQGHVDKSARHAEVEELANLLADKLHSWESMTAVLDAVACVEDGGVYLLTLRRLVKEHMQAVGLLRSSKAGLSIDADRDALLQRLDRQEKR